MNNVFSDTLAALIEAGIENPRMETRIMLAEILKCTPSEIASDCRLTEPQEQTLKNMINLRIKHCPLDKIVGHREFYKYDFITSSDVLSPRPDTEILVEEACRIIKTQKITDILDLGVGSGCIIGSLLADFPHLYGVGADISAAALKIAEQNLINLGINGRCRLLEADYCAENFISLVNEKFDMIVGNPPYIPSAEIETLATEVKKYDPGIALDGGTDGLKYYRKIADIAPFLLNKNGYILLEIGKNQENDVENIFSVNNFALCKTVPDLSGINRCLILQKTVA